MLCGVMVAAAAGDEERANGRRAGGRGGDPVVAAACASGANRRAKRMETGLRERRVRRRIMGRDDVVSGFRISGVF